MVKIYALATSPFAARFLGLGLEPCRLAVVPGISPELLPCRLACAREGPCLGLVVSAHNFRFRVAKSRVNGPARVLEENKL